MQCTVHGIFQAGILEWVAFPFSRGSSQHRDQTQISCITGFTSWATREAQWSRSRCFYGIPLLSLLIWSLVPLSFLSFFKIEVYASLTTLKPLTVWIRTHCGKFLKRWEYQTTLPVSWETCMQVKKQQLEPYMKQWIGSKLGKEYDKAVYCDPVYLTYKRIHHMKCLAGWIKSWKQDCQEKYQQPQRYRWYHSNGRKWKGTKATLDEGERGE